MDKNGYPTKKELEAIRNWKRYDKQGILGLIEHIRDCWEWADYGFFELTGKQVLGLRLATGGWSGNEDVMGVLRDTPFWLLFWEKTERGGGYYFKIDLRKEYK